MGTDAGEVDATGPEGAEVSEPARRRSTFVPAQRAATVSAPVSGSTQGRPSGPRSEPAGPADARGEVARSGVTLGADERAEVSASGSDVHDDDELAVALENEVSLLTASLPIIRPDSLFASVRPPDPAFEPHTETERAIAEQAESGNTLAAIERLEALIAGRHASGQSSTDNVRVGVQQGAAAPFTDDTANVTPQPGASSAASAVDEHSKFKAATDETVLAEAGSFSPAIIPESELDKDVTDDADDVDEGDHGLTPLATPRVRGNEGVLSVGRRGPMPIFSIEQSGLEPTPLEYRVGRATRLFWLWFAAGASVLVVGLGAALVGAGLNLVQVVIAAVLGIALSFLPLGLSSLTGAWSGLPTIVVSRATFGVIGNVVPAVLVLAVRLFWGSALLWLLSVTVADAAVTAQWTSDRTLVLWATFGVAALVCITIALVGYALVAIVQLIATIATAVLGIAIIVGAWPSTGWGRATAAPFGEWIVVVEGAVLVFSVLGLAWASAGGDLARYQRVGSTGTATALWGGFGASLPMLVLVVFGAFVALARPASAVGFTADPVRLLVSVTPHWVAAAVVAAIAVGLVSALMVTLYSGGFAVQAVGIQLPRWSSVLVLGVAVAAAGAGLLVAVPDVGTLLLAYPTTLAVPVAAWTGIFLGDLLLRRRRLATDSLVHRGGVYADWRWANVIGLVTISAVGLGFMRADVPWLAWEGYLYRALGGDAHGALARSDIGVLIALALGLLLGLCAGWRVVPSQESASR